jgi:hypothetical protein
LSIQKYFKYINEQRNIHIDTRFRKLNWINGANKLTYLIKKFSKRFLCGNQWTRFASKNSFWKAYSVKTSYIYKKKLPVVSEWYWLKAKLEVKNFPTCWKELEVLLLACIITIMEILDSVLREQLDDGNSLIWLWRPVAERMKLIRHYIEH